MKNRLYLSLLLAVLLCVVAWNVQAQLQRSGRRHLREAETTLFASWRVNMSTVSSGLTIHYLAAAQITSAHERFFSTAT